MTKYTNHENYSPDQGGLKFIGGVVGTCRLLSNSSLLKPEDENLEDDQYDITIIELAEAVELKEYTPICLPVKKTSYDLHQFDHMTAMAFGNINSFISLYTQGILSKVFDSTFYL